MYIQIINLAFVVALLIQYYNAYRSPNRFYHIYNDSYGKLYIFLSSIYKKLYVHHLFYGHPFIKNYMCIICSVGKRLLNMYIAHSSFSLSCDLLYHTQRAREKFKGPFPPYAILDNLPM
jgi:hypothetical protein